MWAAAALGMVAVIGPHGGVTVDEFVYRQTLAGMRHGHGYYQSMTEALSAVYGAPSSVRAFRLPTVFWLWRWVPFGVNGLRVVFVAAMAVTASVAARAARLPAWIAAVVFVVLLALGGVLPGAPTEQFLLVELWAAPLIAGAWLAWRRGWWWTAAGLATLAVSVREFAVLLVVGGLAAAIVQRRPAPPWVTAAAACVLIGVAHAVAAGGHLTDGGYESPLLNTGRPPVERFGAMCGFGLPAAVIVGPVLFAVAGWSAWRRREWFLAPLLALPLVAVVADRPYWGALVVPFYLWLAADQVTFSKSYKTAWRSSRSANSIAPTRQ